jgi:hypothetical protein
VFKNKKYVRTIIRTPNDLWNEIKNILPDEKPGNTIGRLIVVLNSSSSLNLDSICFLSSYDFYIKNPYKVIKLDIKYVMILVCLLYRI